MAAAFSELVLRGILALRGRASTSSNSASDCRTAEAFAKSSFDRVDQLSSPASPD